MQWDYFEYPSGLVVRSQMLNETKKDTGTVESLKGEYIVLRFDRCRISRITQVADLVRLDIFACTYKCNLS